MRLSKTFTAFAFVALLAAPGFAQQPSSNVNLVFSGPSSLTGAQGTEAFFNGTLTNNSTTDSISLDGISFSFNSEPFFTGDDNIFYNSVPDALAPGQTYTGNIFGINIDATTPVGIYSDNNANITNTEASITFVNSLASPFQINVTPAPVPEPASFTVLGIGVLAVAGLVVRRRRACRASAI